MDDTAVAVIGLAGRFPGADSTSALWDLLVEGGVGLRRVDPHVLIAGGAPSHVVTRSDYVAVHGTASSLDLFDPTDFGMTHREAIDCDPQTRLLLQLVDTVFRDAGRAPAEHPDTAMYVTGGHSRYAELFGPVDWRSSRGMSLMTGTNLDYASSLLSYKYGFRGAAVTVQTACSSSLVAVHQACQALLDGQTGLAVAGGANVVLPLDQGYRWEQGGPVSRSGLCLPFDDAADGTIFSSGGALVLLKRLDDARRDGDRVYAVIEGSAVNNDGADKAGFTAPSVTGQAAVIAEAMLDAGIGPDDLGMIEGHATGTALGDPIEWRGILRAFALGGGRTVGPCPVTAVKGNIGHLGHASGVASLIKAVLAVHHEVVPAIGGFATPNARLAAAPDQLVLPSTNLPGALRHCGVSSFGVGGTNAHVVVGAPPRRHVADEPGGADTPTRPVVIAWAETTEQARDDYRAVLATLPARAAVDAREVERSLDEVNRSVPPHRRFRSVAIVEPTEDWRAVLASGSGALLQGVPTAAVGWVIPGEGSLPAAGVAGLADHARTAPGFDACRAAFAIVGVDLAACSSAFDAGDRSAAVTEPLHLGASYALATAWRELGVEPDFVAGRGVGELCAGVIAGVLDLHDACRLISERARALDALPPVARISFAEPHDHVRRLLPADLDLVLVATDEQMACTFEVGAADGDQVADRAEHLGLRTRRDACRYPASSRRAAEVAEQLARTPLRPVGRPDGPAFVGLSDVECAPSDPAYWSAVVCAAVRDERVADRIDADDAFVMEIGAGHTVTATVNRTRPGCAVATLTDGARRAAEVQRSFIEAAARLWSAGHDVDWSALRSPHGTDGTGRARLPGRPLTGARHWPEPLAPASSGTPAAPCSSTAGELAHGGTTPVHGLRAAALVWTPGTDAEATATPPAPRALGILVGASGPHADDVLAKLAPGAPIVRIPVTGDLRDRVRAVVGPHLDGGLDHLVLGLCLGSAPTGESLDEQWQAGFVATAALAAALHAARTPAPDLTVLTTGGIDLTGSEPHRPGLAAVGPLLRTLVHENAVARAAWLDLSPGTAPLAVPVVVPTAHVPIVAVRGPQTWVRRDVALAGTAPAVETPTGAAYLVTGGAGALAGVLCRHIARVDPRARIMLLVRGTRTLTPAHREAELLGASLSQVECDLGDADAVIASVDALVGEIGSLYGVFHLAGAAGAGVTALADHSRSSAVRAKVEGTRALLSALDRHTPPALLVGFSSRAALGGQPGGADYACANAVMEALLHGARADRVVSVAWGAWSEIGMAVPFLHRPGAARPGISAEDAGPLLERLLTDVLPPRLLAEASVEATPATEMSVEHFLDASGGTAAVVVEGGRAAGSDVVEVLTGIWRELLGAAVVDVDADFFESGGNSLTAVELSTRVEDELGVEVDLVALFESPTIRQLAERIGSTTRVAVTPAVGERTRVVAPLQVLGDVVVEGGRAAGSDVVEVLTGIWRELLGAAVVDVDADFFESGGNSLTAVELSTRVEDELGVEVDLVALFESPTIRQLAELIREK